MHDAQATCDLGCFASIAEIKGNTAECINARSAREQIEKVIIINDDRPTCLDLSTHLRFIYSIAKVSDIS